MSERWSLVRRAAYKVEEIRRSLGPAHSHPHRGVPLPESPPSGPPTALPGSPQARPGGTPSPFPFFSGGPLGAGYTLPLSRGKVFQGSPPGSPPLL